MLHFHKPNKKEKRLLNGNFTFKKPKVSNDNHNEEQRTCSATRKAIEKNHKQNKTLEILTIPYYYYFHTPGNFLIKRFKICSSTLRNLVFLLWGEGLVANHESLIRNRKIFVIKNKRYILITICLFINDWTKQDTNEYLSNFWNVLFEP